MTSSHYVNIVIGAGVEGSATALALQRMGHKTLLVEQYSLDHTLGSSHGASRITRHAYPAERQVYTQMMGRAFEAWAELEKEQNVKLYRKTGLLWISRKSFGFPREMSAVLRPLGHPHALLDNEQIMRRFPFLSYGADFEALFDETAGVLYADKCLQAMHKSFRLCGGTVLECCPVTDVALGQINRVATSKGEFTSDHLAVCVGGWLQQFAAQYLKLHIPTRVANIGVFYWRDESAAQVYSVDSHCPTIIVRDDDLYLYALPSDEHPGLFKLCNHEGHDLADGLSKAEVHTKYVQPLVDHMREHMKGLMCDKPEMTSTNHMIISRHPLHPNVAIAGGMCGQGFKISPVVGETMARLLTGQHIEYDMTDFTIDRGQCVNGKIIKMVVNGSETRKTGCCKTR